MGIFAPTKVLFAGACLGDALGEHFAVSLGFPGTSEGSERCAAAHEVHGAPGCWSGAPGAGPVSVVPLFPYGPP